MKKLVILIILLAGCFCSCKKENDVPAIDESSFLEISPDSKSQVIEKEINGIAFKFCLLNELGEPATVFNRGENFSFYFSVTNNRNEKVIYEPEIVRFNDNFCRVFNSSNQDFGKPYIAGAIDKIGIGGYILDVNEICEFKHPWIDERDDWWGWYHTYFKSSHRKLLNRGNYYTGFKHKFEFIQEDGQTKFYVDSVNFKIKFQNK